MAAYESAKDRMGVSPEEFARAVSSWECVPVEVSGDLCGAILINGPQIHACIKPQAFGRWARRGLRPLLERVIEKHGRAETSMTEGNEMGARFVTRLGFRLDYTKDGISYYSIGPGDFRVGAKNGH